MQLGKHSYALWRSGARLWFVYRETDFKSCFSGFNTTRMKSDIEEQLCLKNKLKKNGHCINKKLPKTICLLIVAMRLVAHFVLILLTLVPFVFFFIKAAHFVYSQTTCFGSSSSANFAHPGCSEGGYCVTTNYCNCESGFINKNCNITNCNSVLYGWGRQTSL